MPKATKRKVKGAKPEKIKPIANKVQSLRKEARSRFGRFIARELDSKIDVGTASLAEAFFEHEETILKKIAHSSLMHLLVGWAEDILNQSAGRRRSERGTPQLVLPMSLQGFEMPEAISFVSGANYIRWVANYKAEIHHLDSHTFIKHNQDEELHASRLEWDRFMEYVGPVMRDTPGMTVREALEHLRKQEAGAA